MTEISNAANDLLYRNGYLPLEQEPRFVSAEFTRQSMLDMFYETCQEMGIKNPPENDEEYREQLQKLNSTINTKFVEHPGIHLGDEYRFSGSVLAVVYSLEHPKEVKSFMIDEGAVVEGALQPVYVLRGPSETVIDILQHNPDPDPNEFEKHVNPYCPMLEIGHAIIQEPDGTVHQVQKHEQLFIVLSNEQMRLERFVIQ